MKMRLFFLAIGPAILCSLIFGLSGHLDGQADPALSAVKPELIVQLGHSSQIRSVAISPDGKLALSGGDDRMIILWDIASGREIRRFDGHNDIVFSVAFSPDGRYIASGSRDAFRNPDEGRLDQSLKMWDAVSGWEVRSFPETVMVRSVEFSPDGNGLLSMNDKGIAKLWDVKTGEQIRAYSLPEKDRAISGKAAFSPDGKIILAGGGKELYFFQADTGELIRSLPIEAQEIKVSSDGKEVLTAGILNSTVRLGEIETGREICSIPTRSSFNSIDIAPDGRLALTTDDDSVLLWEAATGKEIRRLELPRADLGRPGMTPCLDSTSSETVGCETSRQDQKNHVLTACFSRDGRWVLAGTWNRTMHLWETATGRLVVNFGGYSGYTGAAAISPDGRYLVCGKENGNINLWDLVAGGVVRTLTGHATIPGCLSFSSDGRNLLSGSGRIKKTIEKNGDGTVRLWDTLTGRQIKTVAENFQATTAALSSDGRKAFLSDGRVFSVVDVFSGKVIWSYEFSPVVSGEKEESQKKAALEMLAIIKSDFAGRPVTMRFGAFSPDGKYSLHGRRNGTILDLTEFPETGEMPNAPKAFLKGHQGKIICYCFSPDSRYALTGSIDRTVKLWDVVNAREIKTFAGHLAQVTSVMFSADGDKAISAGADGTVKIWPVTGEGTREICTLVTFNDGSWAVTAPDGRFDAGSLEKVEGMHWIAPDDPLTPLPLEIFMRDYYEPRLLPRLLAGEKLLPVRSLMELNRVQPEVRIGGVTLEAGAVARSASVATAMPPGVLPGVDRVAAAKKPVPDDRDLGEWGRLDAVTPDAHSEGACRTVSVTVEVGRAKGEFGSGGQKTVRETGVYDLRLFRDGQLVGQWPDPAAASAGANGVSSTGATKSEKSLAAAGDELLRWRKESEVTLDPSTGRTRVTFHGVRLPMRGNSDKVEFSAYCFNEDRVKSLTDRLTFTLPPALREPVRRRAYIMCMGVNATQDPRWDLRFAANDAKALAVSLEKNLKDTGRFASENVVSLTLVSERGPDKKTFQTNLARKEFLKAVLNALAGRPDITRVLQGIPSAEKLREATPDDAVLLSFAGHGYVDGKGTFCMVPSDTGVSTPDMAALGGRCVSSEELSLWLKDVDAGEMALIVDACHSAGAVQGQGFKPGPMGSRGLGQLSYDKGMRILVATQADDVALEDERLGHGLLTYALVKEGLGNGKAAQDGREGGGREVYLSGWLQYAVKGVPELYADVKSGKRSILSVGRAAETSRTVVPKKQAEDAAGIQQPSVFDFTGGRRDLLLQKQAN